MIGSFPNGKNTQTNKQKNGRKRKKRKPDFCWMTSRDAGSAKISREVGLGGAIKQERKEQ